MDWVRWHHFTQDYTQNTSISPRLIASCWKSSHEPNIVWVNTCPSSSNTGPVEPTCTSQRNHEQGFYNWRLKKCASDQSTAEVNNYNNNNNSRPNHLSNRTPCLRTTHLKLSITICTTTALSPHPRQKKKSFKKLLYILPWCLVLWEASEEAPHVTKDFGLYRKWKECE